MYLPYYFKNIFFLKNLSQIPYEAVKNPIHDVSYYLFIKNLYAQMRIQRNRDVQSVRPYANNSFQKNNSYYSGYNAHSLSIKRSHIVENFRNLMLELERA